MSRMIGGYKFVGHSFFIVSLELFDTLLTNDTTEQTKMSLFAGKNLWISLGEFSVV